MSARLQEPGIGMLSGTLFSPLAAAITATPGAGVASTGLSTLVDTSAPISELSGQALGAFVGGICTNAVLAEFTTRRETATAGGDPHSNLTAAALGWDERTRQFKAANQVVALAEQVARESDGPLPTGRVVQLILAAAIATGHLAFLPERPADQSSPAFSELKTRLASAVQLSLADKGRILGAPNGVAPSSVRSAMQAAVNGSGSVGPRKAVSIAASAPSSPPRPPPRLPTPHPTPKSAAIARLDQQIQELRGSAAAAAAATVAAAAAAAASERRPPPHERSDGQSGRRRELDGQQSGHRRGRDGEPRRERKGNDGICDHFQKPGGCKFGTSCRYEHVKRQ
jgi:hypothetical protein